MKIRAKMWRLIFFCLVCLLADRMGVVAYAHGVVINYIVSETGLVKLDAAFDTGEPMGEAQVAVYAPDDPATPWLTGVADKTGHFEFSVDLAKPGTWDIQFRKAGHGEMIHITIEQVAVEIEAPVSEATTEAATVAAPAGAEDETTTAATAAETEPVKVEAEVAAPDMDSDMANMDHSMPETSQSGADETAKQQVMVVSSSSSGSTGFTTFQILLMSGSVIWGFIGTALYFARRS